MALQSASVLMLLGNYAQVVATTHA
jgi:hypothetical protein